MQARHIGAFIGLSGGCQRLFSGESCTTSGVGGLVAPFPSFQRFGLYPQVTRSRSRTAIVLVTSRIGNGAKAKSYLRVQPSPAPSGPLQTAPWYVKGAAAFIGVVALLRIVGRLRRRGSIGELENRGLIDEDRNAQELADDPFYNKVMKNMNTVSIEELSASQIEAARKRRMRERDVTDGDIEKIDLPENHPFAVKKKVSKEEEELFRARLAVKRGLPLQDLKGTRGLPEEAYRRAAPQQR